MKTNISKQTVITATILIVAVIASGLLIHSKAKIKNQLANEMRKSEVLLSEKLSLNKAIKNYQADVAELKNKSKGLSKLIAEANRNIENKNAEISALTSSNNSLKSYKEKYADLEKLQQQLSDELLQNKNWLARVNAENEKLNNQLAHATNAIESLENDNAILKELFSYNYRTEALRGKNEKLTVNAKRTDKLFVGIDLPGNIGNNVHFKVVTPEGKELSSTKDLAATVRITEKGDGLTAGSGNFAGGSVGTKRAEMTYKPAGKMSKGVYQFNLYNEDRFLGSTQLRLK